MKKGLLIVAATLMTLAPMSAVRGFVVVRRPYFYNPYWYDPFWGPYWGPAYGGYYAYPNSGEVKLDTKVKDAQVFINGSYAGTTHDNKSMHLSPPHDNIHIKKRARTQYTTQVYSLAPTHFT